MGLGGLVDMLSKSSPFKDEFRDAVRRKQKLRLSIYETVMSVGLVFGEPSGRES